MPVRMVERVLEIHANNDATMIDTGDQVVPTGLRNLQEQSLGQSIELQNAVPAAKGKQQKAAHQTAIVKQIAKHVTVNNLSLSTMLAVCKASVAAEIKQEILESKVMKPWKFPPPKV